MRSLQTPPVPLLLLAVLVAGPFAGCRFGAEPGADTARPPAAGETGGTGGAVHGEPEGGEAGLDALPSESAEDAAAPYLIKEAKLERFIEYQEQTLSLYAQMLADLSKAESADGGAMAQVSVVKRHAEAQERARRGLGLSERDVRELERVVGDVISRRAVAGSVDAEADMRQLEALAAKLGPEQRVELDRTLEQLRAQQKETAALTEERRKYGDRNVDLVLSREEVLTRQWNRAIATFSGAGAAPSPPPAAPPVAPAPPDAAVAETGSP